jgi:hypothetical protein
VKIPTSRAKDAREMGHPQHARRRNVPNGLRFMMASIEEGDFSVKVGVNAGRGNLWKTFMIIHLTKGNG